MPKISPLMDHMLPVIVYLQTKDAAPAMVDRVRKRVAEHEASQDAVTELRKAASTRVELASALLADVSARLAADEHPRDVLNRVVDRLEEIIPF